MRGGDEGVKCDVCTVVACARAASGRCKCVDVMCVEEKYARRLRTAHEDGR